MTSHASRQRYQTSVRPGEEGRGTWTECTVGFDLLLYYHCCFLLQITVEERLNAIGSVETPSDGGRSTSTPKTDSLEVLLTQGLLSDDKKMLNVSVNAALIHLMHCLKNWTTKTRWLSLTNRL